MKHLYFLIASALCLHQSGHCSPRTEIPEPYCSIVDLPFDDHGWFGHANSKNILAEIKAKPITTVIEIGSWLGSSTRFIAKSLPDNGKVYAVDTWLGTSTDDIHQTDPRLPHLYQLFLSNVKRANLTHKIVPIRMQSIEAAHALNVKADLIYIDGAHDEESVYNDIVYWYPHLNPEGIMCGDDWLWEGARKAIQRAAKNLNRKIFVEENFWKFE